MKLTDLAFTAASVGVGAWAGWSLGNLPAALVGGFAGLGTGIAAAAAGLRLAVAVPVVIGTIAGGLLGRSIVRALCLPGTCHSTEVVAALLAGVGSLVSVGLVVVLVTKSFDEYREARLDRRNPNSDPGESRPPEDECNVVPTEPE